MKAIRFNPRSHKILPLTLFLAALLFINVTSLNAAGQTSFPVLMELMDARTLALGGAVVSNANHLGSATINPASAVGSGRQIKASYASHMLDLWSGNLSFNQPVNECITVGGFLNNFNYGEFNTSVVGQGMTGATFTSAEYAVGGFCSGIFNDYFRYGGTIKYIWGSIDDNSAKGIAVDAGLTVDPDWQSVMLGISLRNFGKQIDGYGEKNDPMPTELIVGGSKDLQHLPLTINANISLSDHGGGEREISLLPGELSMSYAVGGEFKLEPQASKRPLYLRIGYRSRGQDLRVGNSKDIVGGMSFGIGLPFDMLRIDYAFASLGALGDIHRFGITGILD